MFDIGYLTNETYSLNKNDDTFNKIYIFFEIGLFFSTLAFLPFTVLALYMMWKFPQFHNNLAILYANLYIAYAFLTFGRLISFAQVYFCGIKNECYITQILVVKDMFFAEVLKFSSLVVYFIASNCIIIERIWAIIYLKGYEQKRDYKFIIVFIILQWIISVATICLAVEGYIPIVICLCFAMLLTFASAFSFRYMNAKNMRRYRLSKSVGNAYTLTERYQLAENIKTAPLIKAMVNVNVILNTLILTIVIVIFYSQTVFKKQITKMIFDFLVTFHSPILFSSFIYSIKKWRNIFKGIFIKARIRKIIPRRATVTSHNHNNNQQKMEADIYFEQLNNRWK